MNVPAAFKVPNPVPRASRGLERLETPEPEHRRPAPM